MKDILIRALFRSFTIFLFTGGILFTLSAERIIAQEPIRTQDNTLPYQVYLPVISLVKPLLANGSFEAQSLETSWEWLAPDGISYQLRTDPGLAFAGQQFLVVDRLNGNFGNKSFYQDTGPPEVGKTYRFAIWVRASDEADTAQKPRTGRVALWAFGGVALREHATHNFQVTATSWQCVETALTIAQAGHAALRAEVYLTALDGLDYYFDDAVLDDGGRQLCPSLPEPVAPVIGQGQGFDTCTAPTLTELASWRQNSPYDYFGVYLGGSNHYTPCRQYNQTFQTPAWLDSVRQQGWKLIPIWVGPQAPCNSYNTSIDYDPVAARGEGVFEAQQALAAAANLGMTSPTIIYYDMEWYDTGNVGCHNAVNAFLAGWVSELQNRGHKAGIYGAANAADSWYTLWHVPDSAWVARYVKPGYVPTMTVDLLNRDYITPSYWDNERLFQYSGGHSETWGDFTLNIDNDVADGLLAIAAVPMGARIQDMGLLSAGWGWVWLEQGLFAVDNDQVWRSITPPTIDPIRAVLFTDRQHGWVVSQTGASSFQVWRTLDGGITWQSSANLMVDQQPVQAISLDFLTEQRGWLVAKLETGLNFSRGVMFSTDDGGAKWTRHPAELPVGEPVRFVSEEVAWLVGGPTYSELYLTRDGAQSWERQDIVSLQPGQIPAYHLPVFDNSQIGVMAVTLFHPLDPQLEVYTTANGGLNWQLADRISLVRLLGPGVRVPVAMLDAQHWLVADPNGGSGLPVNTVQLSMLTPERGWAATQDQRCKGASCSRQMTLLQTEDGGGMWTEIPLPAAP